VLQRAPGWSSFFPWVPVLRTMYRRERPRRRGVGHTSEYHLLTSFSYRKPLNKVTLPVVAPSLLESWTAVIDSPSAPKQGIRNRQIRVHGVRSSLPGGSRTVACHRCLAEVINLDEWANCVVTGNADHLVVRALLGWQRTTLPNHVRYSPTGTSGGRS
jgi:hypothetical protein